MTPDELAEHVAKLEQKLKHSEILHEAMLRRMDNVFDAVAKRDVQRDKELIKIINSLKSLLTLQ